MQNICLALKDDFEIGTVHTGTSERKQISSVVFGFVASIGDGTGETVVPEQVATSATAAD